MNTVLASFPTFKKSKFASAAWAIYFPQTLELQSILFHGIIEYINYDPREGESFQLVSIIIFVTNQSATTQYLEIQILVSPELLPSHEIEEMNWSLRTSVGSVIVTQID